MMRKKWVLPALLFLAVMLNGCGEKINALDYVTLGDYKGLAVTRMATTISEEDVQKQVDRMLDAFATQEAVTDRTAVENGDIANIDYEGSIDGVLFDGGSAKGFDLEIGSGTFIEGFEEGLIGAKVGDTLDVHATFPGEYPNNPNLAGKTAVFKVTVNGISRKVMPELTQEFLMEKTGGQFGSVDEIKDFMRNQATASLTGYADSTMYTQLLNEAIENATLKQNIPESYLAAKREAMIRTAKSNAEAYGKTYEEYLQEYLRMDEATFMETVEQSAGESAKRSLVIQAIADTEGITVTDEEFQQKVADTMAEYGYEKKKDLFETITEQDLKDSMLLEKVEHFLADNAVISEQ